jgi:hypothetical protein
MQVPFPELTYLRLWSDGTSLSVLPGGSAPRLRTLKLKGIPFPAVRDLLLSAGDLVDLTLSAYSSFGVRFTRVDGRLLVLFEEARITLA